MELLFVYNAKSGKLDKLMDNARKILNPASYPCKLCNLTHGIWAEDQLWRAYRKHSGHQMTFYYKDEFLRKFDSFKGIAQEFPVVLAKTDANYSVLITSEILKDLHSSEELIACINQHLNPD